MTSISVVVTTYNGEKYIRQQLESIITQTLVPSEIILVDDASTDLVCDIAEEILNQTPIPFSIHRRSYNSGYLRSFEKGLGMAMGDYIAFSDQDDVWYPDKLKILAADMDKLEKNYGHNVPYIVFSDVSVVDEQLSLIAPSFNKTQKLHMGAAASFLRTCAQNVIPGMSMLINRVLAELVQPFPPDAIHHDWWIALICSKYGKIQFVDRPLVYYRQHGANVLGAKMYDDITWFNTIRRNWMHPRVALHYIRDNMRYELYQTYRPHTIRHSKQKLALAERFPEDSKELQKIAFYLCRGGLMSVLWLVTHNILPPAWQRKVFFCLSLLKRESEKSKEKE